MVSCRFDVFYESSRNESMLSSSVASADSSFLSNFSWTLVASYVVFSKIARTVLILSSFFWALFSDSARAALILSSFFWTLSASFAVLSESSRNVRRLYSFVSFSCCSFLSNF